MAPFQDQVHVRAFVLDFLSHHARMLIDWADRTEATLDQWDRTSEQKQTANALITIRANLDDYPPARVVTMPAMTVTPGPSSRRS